MRAVLTYFARAARPEATIVVVPLKGRETDYEGFGFERCPNDLTGASMDLASVRQSNLLQPPLPPRPYENRGAWPLPGLARGTPPARQQPGANGRVC